MGESKTKPTGVTAAAFLARVPDPVRREDAEELVKIFQRAIGEPPVMWGPSIIGLGTYHYKYESGRARWTPNADTLDRRRWLVSITSRAVGA